MWNGTHDLLYLVDGGCPREQGFSQQHLSQDTAETPHVHAFSVPLENTLIIQKHRLNLTFRLISLSEKQALAADAQHNRVPCGSQQDLGSSIPPCGHVLRQCRIPTVLLDLVERSGQAEVTQLDNTVRVQEHIGRLWETDKKKHSYQREFSQVSSACLKDENVNMNVQ